MNIRKAERSLTKIIDLLYESDLKYCTKEIDCLRDFFKEIRGDKKLKNKKDEYNTQH